MNILLYLFLCFLAFSACKNETPISNKTVVVLYDLSASVDNISLQNYTSVSSNLLDQLQDGDIAIGLKISDKSRTERNSIFQCEIPIFNPSTDNHIIRTKEQKDHDAEKADLILQTKNKLRIASEEDHSQIIQTGILAALLRASELLKTYPNTKQQLLICSDMLEAESEVNFEKNIPDDKFAQMLIQKHQSENRLPDLNNVTVFVEGANAKNNIQYNQIKQFWMTYLKACGASIDDQYYSAHLEKLQD